MAEVSLTDLQAKIRFDKLIEAQYTAAPVLLPKRSIRVFRPSSLSNMCPVAAAFTIQMLRTGGAKALCLFVQSQQLPARLTQIVDTGTVIHQQLQYYAGLVGYARRGQWRCPACGMMTSTLQPMPTVRKADPRHKGISNKYPAPCPRCKGQNLGMFPPWRYVEITLEERGAWSRQLRAVGHLDQLWDLPSVDKHFLSIFMDYKTINEQGFTQQYGQLPKDDHVSQIQYYLGIAAQDSAFTEAYGEVKHGGILYYNKNRSEHKLFLFDRDLSVWKKKLADMEWARERGKGSFKELVACAGEKRVCPNLRHKRARECFFVEACWGKNPPANIFA